MPGGPSRNMLDRCASWALSGRRNIRAKKNPRDPEGVDQPRLMDRLTMPRPATATGGNVRAGEHFTPLLALGSGHDLVVSLARDLRRRRLFPGPVEHSHL